MTYQLLSGRTPFDGKNIKKIDKNIVHKDLEFPERYWNDISDEAKDFICRCLDRDQ